MCGFVHVHWRALQLCRRKSDPWHDESCKRSGARSLHLEQGRVPLDCYAYLPSQIILAQQGDYSIRALHAIILACLLKRSIFTALKPAKILW